MQDRIHQPYRMAACPLLARLLPLVNSPGIFGIALSGAGPSVLVIADPTATDDICSAIRDAAEDPELEILQTTISGGARVQIGQK